MKGWWETVKYFIFGRFFRKKSIFDNMEEYLDERKAKRAGAPGGAKGARQ